MITTTPLSLIGSSPQDSTTALSETNRHRLGQVPLQPNEASTWVAAAPMIAASDHTPHQYLMMATELATAVQESIKIITVPVQNHGFASIGALSESLGSQRFGTAYRYPNAETGRLDGSVLPVDLAANAASYGLEVIKVATADEFAVAVHRPKLPRIRW
jgi:hypothetical protein